MTTSLFDHQKTYKRPKLPVLTTHGNPPLAIGGPPVKAILDIQLLCPLVVTGATPVVTSEIFFRKLNCELRKIIENYYFIMESEGYSRSKIYFFTREVLQQLRLFWHRVYASRDVGNAAEQI